MNLNANPACRSDFWHLSLHDRIIYAFGVKTLDPEKNDGRFRLLKAQCSRLLSRFRKCDHNSCHNMACNDCGQDFS